MDNRFSDEQGILIPLRPPQHRDDEYDTAGFGTLIKMQQDHFWYRGRHNLILSVLKKELPARFADMNGLEAIDLGGGCGGWLEYLHSHQPDMFKQLALADSSIRALSLAGPVVGDFALRYQIDLMDLVWSEDWDVAFLLDVLEHIPEHEEALRQIRKSLRPGGLLFVTTPALDQFWSFNDEIAHHQRRYAVRDYRELAGKTGFELLRTDYFMFFLSPALVVSRLLYRPPSMISKEQRQAYLEKTHRVPAPSVNKILTSIFSLEALMINRLGFPWGTSILAVLRRPLERP